MRFDQALAAKNRAREIREPIEYPKYVKVDGQDVLALHAEHEAELLGPPASSPDDDAGEDVPVSNLLSAPEKRKPGRPRIIHPEKD